VPPSLSEFRTTLNVKIFDSVIASNLSASSLSSSTDKWGDSTDSFTSVGTILKSVPYNAFGNRLSYQPFGDLNEGDMDIVFTHDSGVQVDWVVKYVDNNLYQVKSVEDYPYGDGILVYIARLSKYHN